MALQLLTHSEFQDIGGPVDWIILMLIGSLGALCLTILSYVTRAMLPQRR